MVFQQGDLQTVVQRRTPPARPRLGQGRGEHPEGSQHHHAPTRYPTAGASRIDRRSAPEGEESQHVSDGDWKDLLEAGEAGIDPAELDALNAEWR